MGGKIGRGMKPRVKNPDRPKKKEAVVNAESPTVVGQEEVASEPVLEASVGDEKGRQMEVEKDEKVQTLDPHVAPSDLKDLTLSDLEAAMQESISQPEKSLVMGVDFASRSDNMVFSLPVDQPTTEIALGGAVTAFSEDFGPQADGSFRVHVSIPEGWWEPVTQWAHENGVTPEQWLSDRLYEYISSYGQPAGKR